MARPEGLIEGRMVHVVGGTGSEAAGVISDVQDRDTGLCTIHAFVDPAKFNGQALLVFTDVPFDPTGAPGTWHYLNRVD